MYLNKLNKYKKWCFVRYDEEFFFLYIYDKPNYIDIYKLIKLRET